MQYETLVSSPLDRRLLRQLKEHQASIARITQLGQNSRFRECIKGLSSSRIPVKEAFKRLNMVDIVLVNGKLPERNDENTPMETAVIETGNSWYQMTAQSRYYEEITRAAECAIGTDLSRFLEFSQIERRQPHVPIVGELDIWGMYLYAAPNYGKSTNDVPIDQFPLIAEIHARDRRNGIVVELFDTHHLTPASDALRIWAARYGRIHPATYEGLDTEKVVLNLD